MAALSLLGRALSQLMFPQRRLLRVPLRYGEGGYAVDIVALTCKSADGVRDGAACAQVLAPHD